MEDDGQGGQMGEQAEDNGRAISWGSGWRTTGRAASWGEQAEDDEHGGQRESRRSACGECELHP